jgi:hypothetical protein
VHIDENLLDAFPGKTDTKEGDTLSLLLINFALESAINKVEENLKGMKFNGAHNSWPVLMMLMYWDEA